MGVIAISILILGGIGILAALVLYFVAKKFHVEEDTRIAEVEALLPGANCGACGQSGCHAFAVACAGAESLEGLNCPGAGSANMSRIAEIVGLAPTDARDMTAIVRCAGSCSRRQNVNSYDGVSSCAIEASFYAGETPCQYGCLGCGDCVAACPYDALHMDRETHLPVVDHARCVGCGKCVTACPRSIMALAPKPVDDAPLVWVACVNHDKGAVARNECEVSCIGCGICSRVCPTDAPKVAGFAAEINYDACIGCGKCVEKCPRKSILYTGSLCPTEENVEQPQTDKA